MIDLLENQYDKQKGGSIADEEQDHGQSQEVRDAYTRVLDLKIATPALVLNYASFLQEKCQMFEESFRVFERAIELFPWPHKYEIWL